MIFFGVVLPLVVSPIAFFVYRAMQARMPDSVGITYLLLAAGIAIAFTLLAAVVFKMRGFVEFTALHVFYVVGLGWIMPRFLTF